MGSPQAAHLGASTLRDKQRGSELRAVSPEGEAPCFGETGAGACPEPPSRARPQSLARSLGPLQECFGVTPQWQQAPGPSLDME